MVRLSQRQIVLKIVLTACVARDASAADVAKTKDYYDVASNNYNKAWGEGNIHLGYYPDFSEEKLRTYHKFDPKVASETFQAAGVELTRYMARQGGINSGSSVLDLGAGYGKTLMDMEQYVKLKRGVGLDLTKRHIDYAKVKSKDLGLNNLEWFEGSFTDLPPKLENSFTHVISSMAFCHLHEELPTILKQAYKALKPGGLVVINDLIGAEAGYEIGPTVVDHMYARLGMNFLHGGDNYKQFLKDAGFELKSYLNLDAHLGYSYNLLETIAKDLDLDQPSGIKLAVSYFETRRACLELKEYSMNLVIAQKPLKQEL